MSKHKPDISSAAFSGDAQLLGQALSVDPQLVEHVDDDGFYPLHLAALGGHLEVLCLLIDKGANVNAVNGRGFSVLQNAIMGSNIKSKVRLQVVKMLLSAGADPEYVSETAGSITDTAKYYRRSNSILEAIENEIGRIKQGHP